MPNATPAGACQFIFCFKFVPSLQELVSKLELFYFDFCDRTKQVHIKRDSVHHLLDLQNVTKVTLKILVMLARHLAEKLHFDQNLYLLITQCKNIT